MTNEFIPYEEALALKELGFDEPCIKYYWTDGMFAKGYEDPFNYNKRDNVISAPLYQQAFRWFRKNKIRSSVSEFDINNYMYFIDDGIWRDIEVPGYDTYEEAELACLKNLIEVVKENRQ